MRRLRLDPMIVLLLSGVGLGWAVPVSGGGAGVAQGVANGAIALLFFLNGVRLPRAAVRAGLADWRLIGAALALTFLVAPTLAGGLAVLLRDTLPPLLTLGLLYIGAMPSTVQSATAATTMAGGDVAGAVILAAVSNLAGIVLAPALVALLAPAVLGAASPLGAAGAGALGPVAVRIALILLLPFVAGQLVQGRLVPLVARHREAVNWLDRLAIAIAVYVACSGAVTTGAWASLSGAALGLAGAAALALLAAQLAAAAGAGRLLRLDRPRALALFFGGHQKSVAVGAPLAAIIAPPAVAGVLLLPLLLYHLVQLTLAALVAPRLAARAAGSARQAERCVLSE